jgi:ADP-ribose pyrophosphatase
MQAPKLTDIKQIADGWIKKYQVIYERPDGKIQTYDVASRKNFEDFKAELLAHGKGEEYKTADAVCIVGQTQDDKLILIREFRYPLNSWCVAFPAGLVENGEDIISCVNRELREEAGYAIRKDLGAEAVRIMPQPGYSSTGLTDETVQVVFAQVEKVGEPQLEPAEFIEPFELPIDQVADFLETNDLPIGMRCQLILEAFARRH